MNLNFITAEDAEAAVEAVRADTATPAGDVANPGTTTPAGTNPQVTRDDLYSKVLKFVPAPIIGIYLMATNFVIGQADKNEDPNQGVLFGALVVFLLATLAFLVVRKVRIGQIIVSTLAFAVIASASPGWFQYQGWWEAEYATYALIVAGLSIVVFRPRADLPEE